MRSCSAIVGARSAGTSQAMLSAEIRVAPAACAAATRLRVPLAANAVVPRAVLGDLRGVVGQVGELVHHEVGGEGRDGVAQRAGVEDVAHDRFRAQRLQLRSLPGRARHPRDHVPLGGQHGDDPATDHATAAGEEDPQAHPNTTSPA